MPDRQVAVEGDRIILALSGGGTIELSGVMLTDPDHALDLSMDQYQIQDGARNVIGTINLAWGGPGFKQITNAIERYQELPNA